MSTWMDTFILDFSEKYYTETVPLTNKSSTLNSPEFNQLKLIYSKNNKDPIFATLAKLMHDKVLRYYYNKTVNDIFYHEIFDRDITYLLHSVFSKSECGRLLDFDSNYQNYLNIYGKYDVFSVKPHADLVNDLIFTTPPNIDDQSIFKKRLFYIDLPDNCLKINDIDIKAIFADERHVVAMSNYKEKECMFLIKDADNKHLYTNFPENLAFDSIEAIHNLSKLLVLYFDSDQKRYHMVNAIDRNQFASLSNKKKKSKLKKFSLFKFIYMERPSDDKNWRKENHPLRSWNLTHKIQVTGHWRWQPWGEKLLKRKLIWIDEYIKGQGELQQKISMEVLG